MLKLNCYSLVFWQQFFFLPKKVAMHQAHEWLAGSLWTIQKDLNGEFWLSVVHKSGNTYSGSGWPVMCAPNPIGGVLTEESSKWVMRTWAERSKADPSISQRNPLFCTHYPYHTPLPALKPPEQQVLPSSPSAQGHRVEITTEWVNQHPLLRQGR